MADNKYSLRSPASQNRGCWFAVSRCFNSKPISKSTEPIEFENLVTAEKRANDLLRQKQVVTEQEREHALSGNFQQLLNEQERLDMERDNELRRQEEALRMEEEAYYAAKRGASRRTLQQGTTGDALSGQTTVSFSFPTSMNGSEMGPWTSAVADETSGNRLVTKDEDDFDKFLESVKAKQISLTTKASEQPPPSDSEEEIDFGFWEKATSLPTVMPSDKANSSPQQTRTKDVDLDLL